MTATLPKTDGSDAITVIAENMNKHLQYLMANVVNLKKLPTHEDICTDLKNELWHRLCTSCRSTMFELLNKNVQSRRKGGGLSHPLEDQEEIEELKRENTHLRTIIKEKENELKQMKEEVKANLRTLKNHKNGMKNTNQYQPNDLSPREDLQLEIDRLTEELEKKQTELDKVVKDNEKYSTEISELQTERQTFQDQTKSFNRTIEEMTSARENLQRDIDRVTGELEVKQTKLDKVQQENERYITERSELQTERQTFQDQTKSFNSTIEEMTSDRENLQRDIDRVTGELGEKMIEFDKVQKEKAEYMMEVSQLQTETQTLQDQTSSINQRNEELSSTLKIQQQDIKKLSGELAKKDEDINNLKTELEESRRIKKKEVVMRLLRTSRSGLGKAMVEMVSKELTKQLGVRLDARSFDFSIVVSETPADVANGPFFVLCLNMSRVGTNIQDALEGTKGGRDVYVLVLHHTNKENLSSLTPTSLRVTGSELRKLGGIIDMAFSSDSGVYECDLNTSAVDKIATVLKKF